MNRLRCGRSKIYVLMDNEEFPRPIKIGRDNRWIASEVEAWLARQAARRGNGRAATRSMRDIVIPSHSDYPATYSDELRAYLEERAVKPHVAIARGYRAVSAG